MISLKILVLLLVLHFVGDFLAQSDWMATNKSKRWGLNEAMLWHIVGYALVFEFGLTAYGLPNMVMWFIVLNSVLHWATDAITSQATSWLWKRHERHWFFAMIGLDQLIHVVCLVMTWHWMVG